jgi:ABC-type Na+ efflux pump permease subunit
VSRVELPQAWRRIWVIALREIRERGASRSYRLSTIVAVLLVVGLILLPSLMGKDKTYEVGLTGRVEAGTVAALESQAAAVDHELTVSRYATLVEGSGRCGTRTSTSSSSTARDWSGATAPTAR